MKFSTLLLLFLFYAQFLKGQEIDNFVPLPGGEFPLGDENIKVKLSPFHISPTEVTYDQMALFALDNGEYRKPEQYGEAIWGMDGERAAFNVSWYDAIRYANWLSRQRGLDVAYVILDKNGKSLMASDAAYWEYENWEEVNWQKEVNGYRLPTETEWEYAASGYAKLGYKQEYSGCDKVDSLKYFARYNNNSNLANKVKSRRANALGLYDMSGNVLEWCWDWHGSLEKTAGKTDPSGPESGSFRVLRGGGWSLSLEYCRSSCRSYNFPEYAYFSNGFRLVRFPQF